METTQVYSFGLKLDWDLLAMISRIDRFDATWSSIEKREGQSLKQLKSIATVQSVGASTRIEGSKMNDEEIDVLLRNLKIEKLEERDEQEVAGYFEVLEIITDSYNEIAITPNPVKDLHKRLLKYSAKDAWHKGEYKQVSNSVEATLADGSKQIIFTTTLPGIPTNDAMDALFAWYHNDQTTHALVKCAVFTYEFLSIHPFQDGNGRMSRLISTLLLMQNGYHWIQYISFEHEIENRKIEYYQKLRECQAQRPNEEVTSWVIFFFDAILHVQQLLMDKLKVTGTEATMTPKAKNILILVSQSPGIQSGEIARKLNLPIPTVKRILSEMVEDKLVERIGVGRGSSYKVMN